MGDVWRTYRKQPVLVRARGPIEEAETIETWEGELRAKPGDYIIEGVAGELYPCKPDVFKQTYSGPLAEGD